MKKIIFFSLLILFMISMNSCYSTSNFNKIRSNIAYENSKVNCHKNNPYKSNHRHKQYRKF